MRRISHTPILPGVGYISMDFSMVVDDPRAMERELWNGVC